MKGDKIVFNYPPPNRNGHPPKGHLIKVTGEGEIAALPDTASINLGVITENKELVASQQQNSKEISKVIQSLLLLGIPKNHLQTFDYRIESVYDYVQGKQIFRGYKITNLLKVKIEDLSMIGKIVDTAVHNGANYVSNVQFTLKDKESFYQQALILAINNATEKAKTIAKTINVTLIPTPILVQEADTAIKPFYSHHETFVKGVTSTQIEPGELLIKANIAAEFQYY
jgi:uncharacterized protein YggE